MLSTTLSQRSSSLSDSHDVHWAASSVVSLDCILGSACLSPLPALAICQVDDCSGFVGLLCLVGGCDAGLLCSMVDDWPLAGG